MENKNPKIYKILYHSFNQDLNYFLAGTEKGCKIYDTYSIQKGFDLSKFIFIIIIFKLFKK